MIFTPGNWRVVNGGEWVESSTHGFICDLRCPDREDYDDAYLIAASRDLLEALEEIVAISDSRHLSWDKAKAAMAKAKGQPSASVETQ